MADEQADNPGSDVEAGPETPVDASTEDRGGDGLDLDAERERLDEVEGKIEEARRALADVEEDVHPEPDGPPVAAGEGAANAPPG